MHIKNNVKYLGITIQDDLGWEIHVNNLPKGLRQSVAILCKVRHYETKWLIQAIYYFLFNYHMIYCCQIWGQHKTNLVKRVIKLKEKATRLINFKDDNAQVSSLFAQKKILKFEDFVHCRNINLPASFNNFFIRTQEIHQHNTRGALNNLIDIPQSRTSFYGTHSIKSKSAIAWNTMQYKLGFNFKDYDFKHLKRDFLTVFLQPTKSKTNNFTLSLITQYVILKLSIILAGC